MRLHEIAELQEKIYQETQDYSKSIIFKNKRYPLKYTFNTYGKIISESINEEQSIGWYDLTDTNWEIIEGLVYDKTNN